MRPTRELKTDNHTFVLNDYITGGENWQIRQVYLKGLKSGDAKDGSMEIEAERKAFELVVVSMDNSSENIADRVMALPLSEYRALTAQVTDIVEAKKKSENS